MNEFNLWDGLPRALEFFDEKQLKFLSHSLPIEELQELRTFEQSLRKQFGNSYRSRS